jgi:2,3-bisphosphoglycerate-independent phosphoglycerate mutase
VNRDSGVSRQVLFIFVDGLGLGAMDPAANPVVAARTPFLDRLLGRKLAGITAPLAHDGVLVVPTDATLGVPGLPQSATGQTALLTGLNAPQIAGRHVTAYPTRELRDLLTAHNVFGSVKAAGGTAAFANAFTPDYFRAVQEGRLRHAAFTFAAMAADVPLRSVDDLRRGDAVFHDLTNARPRGWGYDVPLITPQDAGRNLARIAARHHLTVFEFFLTDLAAHRRIDRSPVAVIEMLDALLQGAAEAADLRRTLVLLASDHGNIEDGDADTHTRNPVPTMLIGAGRETVGRRVHMLTDIKPALVDWLAEEL